MPEWFQNEKHRWPPEAGAGVVSPAFKQYLPDGFDFTKEHYVLDFDNWGGTPFEAGVTVTTSDSELGLTLLDMLPPPKWTGGDKYTCLFE